MPFISAASSKEGVNGPLDINVDVDEEKAMKLQSRVVRTKGSRGRWRRETREGGESRGRRAKEKQNELELAQIDA